MKSSQLNFSQNQMQLGQEWRLSEHYFRKMLSLKGEQLSRFETAHIMMLYFFTEGLAVLDKLTQQDKKLIEEYVLSLEIPSGGWAPSSLYAHFPNSSNAFHLPHIVFTYSAINVLTLTGGLLRINKQACLNSVSLCAKENGSYSNFSNSQEADLRFVYSAVSICHALNDFSGMNVERVIRYIHDCKNFDGGYGLRPHCESHSGAIYCALSSLKMLQKQPQQPKRTLAFLVNRQATNLKETEVIGVQGRVGKLPDSCYSFWVGASICLLTGKNLLHPGVQNFLQLCFKSNECSFSKYPTNESGDPVHTLHAITGLQIIKNQHSRINLQRGIVRAEKEE